MSTRYGLVFYEDRIVVPTTLRASVLALLHQGHPAIIKMTHSAETFWWPRTVEDIERKCETCTRSRMSGNNIKSNIPKSEINQLPKLNETDALKAIKALKAPENKKNQMRKKCSEVNGNEFKFNGRTNVKVNDNEQLLNVAITKENVQTVIGMYWMKNLKN